MPLGDSITYGYNEASGNSYRRDLECYLHAGGNPVQLIGSIKNGDWENNDNDGFILHTIDEIRVAGTPELTAAVKPNVILLHAGSVDMVFDVNVTTAPIRLGNLVDFITAKCPEALLIVAQLIPNANVTVEPRIQAFNAEVPRIVKARARFGKKVVLASMGDVTKSGLLSDGTHPNEIGGREMALNWYGAIVEAGKKGLIVPAQSPFDDEGPSSLPPSGRCSDLKD